MGFEPAALPPRDAPQAPDTATPGEPSEYSRTGRQNDDDRPKENK